MYLGAILLVDMPISIVRLSNTHKQPLEALTPQPVRTGTHLHDTFSFGARIRQLRFQIGARLTGLSASEGSEAVRCTIRSPEGAVKDDGVGTA